MQHLLLRREGIWGNHGAKTYPEHPSKNVIFHNHLCGKKDFLPFAFSSDITTSIYGIYKLLDKHTSVPHFQGHYSVSL